MASRFTVLQTSLVELHSMLVNKPASRTGNMQTKAFACVPRCVGTEIVLE